jgi:hypothetical protein
MRVALATLIAALLTTGPATAQMTLPGGAVPMVISAKQITVQLPPDPAVRKLLLSSFAKATGQITSCDQVDGVAKQFEAGVVTADRMSLSAFPPALRAQVATRGPGRATDVFGMQDGILRVIVRCS